MPHLLTMENTFCAHNNHEISSVVDFHTFVHPIHLYLRRFGLHLRDIGQGIALQNTFLALYFPDLLFDFPIDSLSVDWLVLERLFLFFRLDYRGFLTLDHDGDNYYHFHLHTHPLFGIPFVTLV